MATPRQSGTVIDPEAGTKRPFQYKTLHRVTDLDLPCKTALTSIPGHRAIGRMASPRGYGAQQAAERSAAGDRWTDSGLVFSYAQGHTN